MMGDNRDNSQDSRYWGFMPRDYVKGKALFVYFSFGEGDRACPGCWATSDGAGFCTRYTDHAMKTVLKLVIAVALLNAVVRGADSVWNYYQLKDAAERALLFGAHGPAQQIHAQIMERAMELRVPLKPEDLTRQLAGWPPDSRSVLYAADRVLSPATQYPVLYSFNVDTLVGGHAVRQ